MPLSQNKPADETIHTDVVIVGSGLIGATFARVISERHPKAKIVMIEAGPRLTPRPGAHVRTIADAEEQAIAKRRSQGPMTDWPPERMASPDATDPEMRSLARPGTFLLEERRVASSMPAAAMSACVGGMGAHWTCAVPRPRGSEMIDFIPEAERETAFREAERIVGAQTGASIDSEAIRTVKQALAETFGNLLPSGEDVIPFMPLAAARDKEGHLTWFATDTVLGSLADKEGEMLSFHLLSDTLCRRILHDGVTASGVLVEHRSSRRTSCILAKTVVVTADSLRTPQLLWASGIRPEALGRYLNEHICLVGTVIPAHTTAVIGGATSNAGLDELLAGLWVPFDTTRHPFHGQITCLGRGDVPPQAQGISTIRLSWYSPKEIRADDRLLFSDEEVDFWGLPRMSIAYELTSRDREAIGNARQWLTRAAEAIGPFLAGHEPRLLPNGSSLHYQGTVRMGEDPSVSVCDSHSRVWGFANLYVGGNGVIPTATASNPTLTSMALAARAACDLVAQLRRTN